jgi:hypothetical protein
MREGEETYRRCETQFSMVVDGYDSLANACLKLARQQYHHAATAAFWLPTAR